MTQHGLPVKALTSSGSAELEHAPFSMRDRRTSSLLARRAASSSKSFAVAGGQSEDAMMMLAGCALCAAVVSEQQRKNKVSQMEKFDLKVRFPPRVQNGYVPGPTVPRVFINIASRDRRPGRLQNDLTSRRSPAAPDPETRCRRRCSSRVWPAASVEGRPKPRPLVDEQKKQFS